MKYVNEEEMRKSIQLILLVVVMLIFAGCLPSYHYGYMGTEQAPIINNRDTGLSNYTGVSISMGGASNENENSITAKLKHQINYTHKWCSFSLHANAYTGFHSVEEVEEYKGKSYDYYGFAPQFSTSLFYPFKTARLGVYGSLGTFWEFGPYVDWLEKAEADSLINISGDEKYGNVSLGSLGILYEKIYSEDKMTSFQVGTGVPGMLHGMINFNNHNHVVTLGLSTIFEGNVGLYLGYLRKW